VTGVPPCVNTSKKDRIVLKKNLRFYFEKGEVSCIAFRKTEGFMYAYLFIYLSRFMYFSQGHRNSGDPVCCEFKMGSVRCVLQVLRPGCDEPERKRLLGRRRRRWKDNMIMDLR